MDAWATTYAGMASFVCVSCAGPGLAAEFGRKLKLKTCTNTWVDEDDMPSWGQLGCSGFIILDGARTVVCRQSPAYLEVREQAFDYVDTLLSSLVAQKAPAAIAPGAAVRIAGLVSKPELNGLTGVCVGGAADGRYNISLEDGRSLSVKPSNLELVDEASEYKNGETFDSVTGGCGDCGCAKAARPEAKRALEEDTARVEKPKVASVKNAEIDDEHERCAAALERLVSERSEEAAHAVLQEYEAHFAHEESLLDTHLYAEVVKADGGAGGGFSADGGARRSHYNDHQRLLSDVRTLLGKGSVPADAIAAVVRDFERHAEAYDGSYADRLATSLAAAAS